MSSIFTTRRTTSSGVSLTSQTNKSAYSGASASESAFAAFTAAAAAATAAAAAQSRYSPVSAKSSDDGDGAAVTHTTGSANALTSSATAGADVATTAGGAVVHTSSARLADEGSGIGALTETSGGSVTAADSGGSSGVVAISSAAAASAELPCVHEEGAGAPLSGSSSARGEASAIESSAGEASIRSAGAAAPASATAALVSGPGWRSCDGEPGDLFGEATSVSQAADGNEGDDALDAAAAAAAARLAAVEEGALGFELGDATSIARGHSASAAATVAAPPQPADRTASGSLPPLAVRHTQMQSSSPRARAASIMSQTLRNEVLMPRGGLTVVLPEHLRHHHQYSGSTSPHQHNHHHQQSGGTTSPQQHHHHRQPAATSPLLPPKRGVHDPVHDPIDRLLGNFGVSKTTATTPFTRPIAARHDPIVRKAVRSSSDAPLRGGLPRSPGRGTDGGTDDGEQLLLPPQLLSSGFPMLQRTAGGGGSGGGGGVGAFLTSKDQSFAAGAPLRYASNPGAPAGSGGLADDPLAGSVQPLYMRRHRVPADPPTATSPERVAVLNPKILPNGIPVGRLAMIQATGRPQPRQDRPDADEQQLRISRSSPTFRRRAPDPLDEADEEAAGGFVAEHSVPISWSRTTAEPVLDPQFYSLVQSHFVTLSDAQQQRLQLKLNAGLPVILQAFGCTGSPFDRVTKAGPRSQ